MASAVRRWWAWTCRTCGTTPRPRTSAGSVRCSSGSGSPPTAARPSAAPCSPCRRWTGSSVSWTITSPRSDPGQHPAFWVTERRGRLSKRSANEAFENARQSAGLPGELDLHSLRHSMITHLVEFDYPERFVQDQAGHKVAATTAIYTGVSDEYRNRLLKSKLTAR